MANNYKFTNGGVNVLLDRFSQASPTYTVPTYGSVGTGTTEAEITDTALETPIIIDSSQYLSWDAEPVVNETAKKLTLRYRVGASKANGNLITEFGASNNDTSKILISHGNINAFSKTVTDELIIQENIIIDNEGF
jgi:hypothetical protein